MFVFMVRFTGVATLAKAIGKEMKGLDSKKGDAHYKNYRD